MKPESIYRRKLLLAALTVALGMSSGSAFATDGLDPDADAILRAMSKHIAGLKSFSVSADISNEAISTKGEKLQFNASSELLIDRPSHLRATRQGRFTDAVISYDGAKLSLYGKSLNAYLQTDLKGTVDDAIRTLEQGTGLPMPAADLLLPDAYTALTSDVVSSGYYGKTFVGGVEVHHLGFRTPNIDWQIWVKTGSDPLPMKYVITSKWITGAPQYSIQLSNWNTRPNISNDAFKFNPPKNAQKLESLLVDETGEIMDKQEGK